MHPPTMAASVVPRPPWCLTPGAATYDNQPIFCATVACGGAGSGALGTMVVVVGNLRHDVSIDVVGCCDVCFARQIS
jgi:hypothetical protein